MKVGYLGPAGTFTQQAAKILFPEGTFIPIGDIDSIFECLSKGAYDAGIAPIENSTEGPVNATLDALLREKDLTIATLLVMPVSHILMTREKGVSIKKILAHPQALAQCRNYIRRHYPQAELVPCASNGEAATKVIDTSAAIGPAAAAKEYGLYILAEGIQDSTFNSTAFIQIEKAAEQVPKDNCRASIAFSTKNQPGALYRMLSILEGYGINMTKILSRPLPESPGEYIFFVDIDDYSVNDAKAALKQIQNKAAIYKFLGSYPVRRISI